MNKSVIEQIGTRYTNLVPVILCALILICNFSLGSAQMPDFNKKLDRTIGKLYNDKSVIISKRLSEIDTTFPNRLIYQLYNKNENIGFLVVNRSFGCHLDGCEDALAERDNLNNLSYEEFYYAIVFNLDLTIKCVKILSYDSEYGYEITSRRWLRQFREIHGSKLKYNVNVDGISGATVSVNSLINDIVNLCYILEEHMF